MDRGAWTFFVDGVTCLVVSVSVCEEERKRRERMKGKMKEKMKREVKNVFFEKCLRTSNPPAELPKNVSKKKKPSDELFLHFYSKVQNLTVFLIICMIRIRFFESGELIHNGFRRARYFYRATAAFRYHFVDVGMFFLWKPYVMRYSRHQTRTHKTVMIVTLLLDRL